MKKLFTLLTLALFAMVVNAQTAGDTYLDIAKYASIESAGIKTSAVDELISFDKTNHVLTISAFGAYQSAGTQKWITTEGSGSTDAEWTAPEGSVFKGSAYYHTSTAKKASTVKSDRTTYMKVTGCSKIEALVISNGTSDTKAVVVSIFEEGVDEPVYTATDKTKTNVILGKDGLDPAKVYTLKVTGTGSSNSRFFEAAFTLGQSTLANAEVTNWNTLFGTSYTGTVSNVDALNGTIAGTTINVTYAKGSGSMYVKDDQIRIYAPTVITIACDPAKPMKKVVVSHSASDVIFLKSTDGLYDKDTKTWTGSSNVVILQRGDEGTTGNVQLTKLSITYDNGEVGTVVLDPIFAFRAAGVKAIMGQEFTTPVLKSNSTSTPAYSSTNAEVATVDAATGAVTLVAPGTTTIKAAVEANETDKAAEASYVLSVAPAGTVFFAPMATGLDGFTASDAEIWGYNSQYTCAYGTAYNKNKTGQFDLASPVIDLTEKQGAVLTFSHAGRYFAETVSDQAKLMVKEEADGAEWAEVAIPNHVTNTNFNWVESGDIDLSAYDGKKIKIAFRYINDESKTGTWEIKNVVLKAGEPEPDAVPAAPAPTLAADKVYNIFSDTYGGAANGFHFEQWGAPTTKEDVELATGDVAWHIANMTYHGTQFAGDDFDFDASEFKSLHMDIYPVSEGMELGITPVCKNVEGSGNEAEQCSNTGVLTAGQWNQVEIAVADMVALGNTLKKVFQLKFTGKDQTTEGHYEYYIDNIYFEKVAEEPDEEVKLYVLGGTAEWTYANNAELTFDETAQAFKYEIDSAADYYFAFADKNDCASWEELNGEHRLAIAADDQVPELNKEIQLVKANGTIKLAAGKYTVTVTKDFKMTITGEAADGISNIAAEKQNGVIYNLQGQRVNAAQKGIYIMNGKKVLVK